MLPQYLTAFQPSPYSVVDVLRSEKAPDMTALLLRHHQCQLSVSGALRFHRIVFSQVLLSLDPRDCVVQFYCVPADEKIHIYPKLLSLDIYILLL